MSKEQPEALPVRLAKRLCDGISTGHDWPNTDDELLRMQSASELRRLHAENELLRAQIGQGEPLLQRIAHLEATASANYGRGHADAHSMLSERIAELERQLEEAQKDAERYRWIRKQHWSENILGVVVRPKDQTKLGSMLPSMELLDDTIDHMSSEGAAMQKGQS